MTGKKRFVRTTLTLALPLILIWAFVETLLREIGSACWYAWNDVQQNVEAYRREMRREDY
jgi:hypothetical protein